MKHKLEIFFNDNKEVLVIDYGLANGKNPYFSITGSTGEKRQGRISDPLKTSKGSYDFVSAGCIHETILEHRPDFQDIVNLHLSDINGVPMHVYANGLYFYTDHYPSEESWFRVLREHLRINIPECQALIEYLDIVESTAIQNSADAKEELQYAFKTYVDSTCKPRWKTEADNVIEKYKLV